MRPKLSALIVGAALTLYTQARPLPVQHHARCGGLFSPCGRKKAPGLPLQKNDVIEDDGEVKVIICEGCELEDRENHDIINEQSQEFDTVQKAEGDTIWQIGRVSRQPEPESTDPTVLPDCDTSHDEYCQGQEARDSDSLVTGEMD